MLFSVCFSTGADQMTLSTLQSMNVVCGGTVKLPCSIDKNVTVMNFHWTDGKEIICDYKGTVKGESQNISCEYTDNESLVLTIKYVLPSNSGVYHCFLFTNSAHTLNTTTLQVSGGFHENRKCIAKSMSCDAICSNVLKFKSSLHHELFQDNLKLKLTLLAHADAESQGSVTHSEESAICHLVNYHVCMEKHLH